MKQEELVFDFVGTERKEEQLELFNKTFGQSFTLENWNNKHFSNPYVGCSENIGLFDNDKLVAFNMFMPQEYIINGKKEERVQALTGKSVLLPRTLAARVVKELA